MAGAYIDMVQLAEGTAVLYPRRALMHKIDLLRMADIAVCPGGILLELAWAQGRTEAFFAFAKEEGFTAIEVSEGTYGLPERDKLVLIERAARLGFRVISAVGKNLLEDDNPLPPVDCIAMIRQECNAGAWKIALPGGGGKGISIDAAHGMMSEELLEVLATEFGVSSLLFDASQTSTQLRLQQHYGTLVNIRNVSPDKILAVAAMRCGIHPDTTRAELPEGLQNTVTPVWDISPTFAAV
jgi:phosphosulfolactate synthase